MSVSTDVATIIRTALDQSEFVFYQKSFTNDAGVRVDDFLVRYSYNGLVKTEIDYLLSLMTYADGAKILAFYGSNTHFYEHDQRNQLLEALQQYLSRHNNPKAVLRTRDTVLQTRTEAHYPVNSGLSEEIFTALFSDFRSANYSFLRWMNETDHGRQIPADDDDVQEPAPPEE